MHLNAVFSDAMH